MTNLKEFFQADELTAHYVFINFRITLTTNISDKFSNFFPIRRHVQFKCDPYYVFTSHVSHI